MFEPVGIRLTADERDLAMTVADNRSKINQDRGVEATPYNHPLQTITHRGMLGEMAFCKLMNVFPDLQWHSSMDYDAILAPNIRVDVKTVPKMYYGLQVKHTYKDKDIDYFALMCEDKGDPLMFWYMGAVKSDDVYQEKYWVDARTDRRMQHDCWLVPNSDLYQIKGHRRKIMFSPRALRSHNETN